jgi:NitT/TauT family transport system substrate-binding protein
MGTRRAGVLLACMAVAVLLAACGSSLRHEQGGGSDTGAAAAGSGPREISVAGVFCVCFTGAYVAWKQGFFEREGVPIKDFVMTKGGADTFQALAGGDVDFGLSGLDAVIRGREKGVKVRGVGTVSPEFYALTVRKDLEGEIRGVEDLKGKKVAISKIGSASWAFLQFVTRRAGLKEGDVEIVQLGGIDTIIAGLKSDRVDAAVTWEPGTAQVRADGLGTVLLDALDPADHQEIYGTDASIGMLLAAHEDLLTKNPELVKRTVRALNDAYAWMGDHSPEEVADVIAPLAGGLDREVLTRAVSDTMKAQPRTTELSREAYDSSAKVLQEAGVIESVPPLDQTATCEFSECR